LNWVSIISNHTSRCRRRACPGDPGHQSKEQAESRWRGQAGHDAVEHDPDCLSGDCGEAILQFALRTYPHHTDRIEELRHAAKATVAGA